jgi:hypothetical protein
MMQDDVSFLLPLQVEWVFSRPGCIELTHNWGSEESDKEPYYCNGNDDSEKQGFGHIGLVPKLPRN